MKFEEFGARCARRRGFKQKDTKVTKEDKVIARFILRLEHIKLKCSRKNSDRMHRIYRMKYVSATTLVTCILLILYILSKNFSDYGCGFS
jgi:hypothetical protein